MVAANRYLVERFLPAYNQRFVVPAPEPGTAFVPGLAPASPIALCARRAGRGQRQYGAVSGDGPADSARPASLPLCEGHGPGPCVSGWDLGRVPWPPVPGALPCGWSADRDRTCTSRPQQPDPRIGRPADRSILGQRCAKQFRRAAEIVERKTRTHHALHTPDKLTCYLQRDSRLSRNIFSEPFAPALSRPRTSGREPVTRSANLLEIVAKRQPARKFTCRFLSTINRPFPAIGSAPSGIDWPECPPLTHPPRTA